jgi:glucosamine--fructose-6-phosphate aminotransferase (isomerizing)
MFLAESEIAEQFDGVEKTINYMLLRKRDIEEAFDKANTVAFIGSGSSYSIAKSARTLFLLRGDKKSLAISAGDLLLNFSRYRKTLEGSLIVLITRSGNTSELVHAAKKAKTELRCECVLICSQEGTDAEKFCSLKLILPWAFDKSVCQTSTVSNLYTACVMLAAIALQDELLLKEIPAIPGYAAQFKENYLEKLTDIGRMDFDHCVVLADCEIAGLAEEGALAFREISRIHSNQYNLLDVRHGPIVLIRERTLVILTAYENNKYVEDLVKDIKRKGAYCLTLGMFSELSGGDCHIALPSMQNLAAAALYMIFSMQVIALGKALERGINPDEPEGLSAWVRL